jgi:hypothetical protein
MYIPFLTRFELCLVINKNFFFGTKIITNNNFNHKFYQQSRTKQFRINIIWHYYPSLYPLYQYQYLFVCQKISMCIHESVLVTEISILNNLSKNKKNNKTDLFTENRHNNLFIHYTDTIINTQTSAKSNQSKRLNISSVTRKSSYYIFILKSKKLWDKNGSNLSRDWKACPISTLLHNWRSREPSTKSMNLTLVITIGSVTWHLWIIHKDVTKMLTKVCHNLNLTFLIDICIDDL